MATKVRVKSFNTNKITNNIKKKANRALSTKKLSNELTKIFVDSLQNKGGLKALTDKTIKRRKRLATVNRTSKGYSASKSNATFTGQFLKNTRVKYFKTRKAFELVATGRHRGYELIKGGRSKTVLNRDILSGQIERTGESGANSFQGVMNRASVRKQMAIAIARVLRRFIKNP